MSLPQDFLGRIIFIIKNYGQSLLKGAGTTLIIALVGTIIGCLIGLIVGIIQTIPVRKKDNFLKKMILKTLKLIMDIYVEVFRGTPMMVQAMFIYYGSAMLFEINMDMWFAAFFIVSINTGAYMAETVRGGILSVPDGQTEGAKAIGMNHFQTMLYVILPQAIRNIMPQIGNNLIINSNRFPRTGFMTIDKKLFEDNNARYTSKNLLNQLFFSRYFSLGFIDMVK
jgi:His/Glu/Gln/Arg/opine family amino acid ABC transporter permease subunit